MNKIRMLVTMLSVFGCVLFGSSVASAQTRTVLVSPVPGDPRASGGVLRNALAGISSPSPENRWLLKIEPGVYELTFDALVMRPWVDIEGSGIDLTIIRRINAPSSAPTISGASNAELRMLTVEATANSGGSGLVLAMFNSNAHPRIYRVRFVAQTNTTQAYGMQNVSSAPKIEECDFSVFVNAFGGLGIARGVSFVDFVPLAVGRSSIVRSRIMVSGAQINYGVYMFRGQTVAEIQETRIDANGSGSSNNYGIYAATDGWPSSEMLNLRNVVISAAGGSQAAGIFLEAGTQVGLDIYHSKVWGHIAPTTRGIFQGSTTMPIGLRHSSIVGFTKTVETSGNVSIAWTDLIGGPVTGAPNSWIGCMGVGDESGIFYPNSCPQ